MKYTLKDNLHGVLESAYYNAYEDWSTDEVLETMVCEIAEILEVVTPRLSDEDKRKLIKSCAGSCAMAYNGLNKEDVKNAMTCITGGLDNIITDDNYSIDAIRILIDEEDHITEQQLKSIEDILVKNMTDELVELLAPYEDGQDFLIKYSDLNPTITTTVNMHRLKDI